MITTQRIKELLKQIRYKASEQAYEDSLRNFMQAVDTQTKLQTAEAGPGLWRVIMKSSITKLAVAAVAIIAVGLLLHQNTPEPQRYTVKTVHSPAEMLTVLSLRQAYDAGGIEAVERQCNEAYRKLSPRPDKDVSIRDIFN